MKVIESEHEGLFLSVTRIDEKAGTDIEVIADVDRNAAENSCGQIRLEQAAMHIQHLSDISGHSPMQIAGEIAKLIENGEIHIENQ